MSETAVRLVVDVGQSLRKWMCLVSRESDDASCACCNYGVDAYTTNLIFHLRADGKIILKCRIFVSQRQLRHH